MPQGFFRQDGRVHSSHDHMGMAFSVKKICQLITPGSRRCHAGQAENIRLFQQRTIIYAGIQLLVYLHMMSGPLQDTSKDQGPGYGIGLAIYPAAPTVGRKTAQTGRRRDKNNIERPSASSVSFTLCKPLLLSPFHCSYPSFTKAIWFTLV